MGTWLGIFAKEPIPGRVKTRLCPPLAPAQAARLYETALRETVAAMSAPGRPFRVVLCPAGDSVWFRRAFPDLPLLPQGEGELGVRMERVLRHLIGRGAAAVLIGSDSPDLPPALVEEAFSALHDAEAVVAPACDGGYVLIGESRHHPELFREIPWSTSEVLEVTRRRAVEAGIAYREIGGWEDVDDLFSLQRLIRRSPGSETGRLARLLLASVLSSPPVPLSGSESL